MAVRVGIMPAAVGIVLLAACGSGSGASTAAGASTPGASTPGASAPGASAGPGAAASGAAVAPSTSAAAGDPTAFCAQVRSATAVVKAANPPDNPTPAQYEKSFTTAQTQLRLLAAAAPPDIAPALQVVLAATTKFVDIVAADDWDISKISKVDQDKATAAMQTPEAKAAQERWTTYRTETCHVS